MVELACAAAACDTASLMTQRATRFFAFIRDIGAGLPGV
jgi:hypothetical protein